MHPGQHAARRGEVAARPEIEKLDEQVGALVARAMRQRFGGSAARRAQRREAVGLGGKSVGKLRFVQLHEYRAAVECGAVAAVDAAAADWLGVSDGEMFGGQPEV